MRTSTLFGFAGVMFAVYPILRPYSSETGMAGAEAFGSPLWVAAHTCAMLGFIALGLGMLYARGAGLPNTAVISTWIGIGLVLPYYGAEAFALNAIGRSAVDASNPALLDLASSIRYSAVQMTMFGVGLVLIAIGTVAFARQHRYARVLAVGFVLFLPQFFAPPELRIAHGILILVGSLLVARAVRVRRMAVAV
ncbi:hypothetical protein [Antrihabitans cavernicola]|uniref:DUF998 domain-containing protein n=1 Tax=Antrihabitans cavernicola TaxID=2495913 RepID=A0A5A7SA53_9NOCA|nr:hypothetical protein [Spelaeibacter cavernicola]KAA0021091.1 hypothetical protein FOY51_20960 [Spelaeibacter cavernicola]